jgi:hypothetical protein
MHDIQSFRVVKMLKAANSIRKWNVVFIYNGHNRVTTEGVCIGSRIYWTF